MWVTSRTPEGLLPEEGGDSECSFSPKGEWGGWSQTGLKIAANYQHMCRSGRNITDPPSALCIKRRESGYCCFIQSNEDKRVRERRGGRADFKKHHFCCCFFNPDWFLVLKEAFIAFTQPVSPLVLHIRAALVSPSNSFVHLCGIFWVLKDFFLSFFSFMGVSIHFTLGQNACQKVNVFSLSSTVLCKT